MPRETVEAKARRYISEGRLHVEHVDSGTVSASCAGRETYRLGYSGERWWCDCPARGRCAHLEALWLVAVPDLGITTR